jgi:putative peptidoglycan lipid II flippase
LYRGLRRQGIFTPQPGWRVFFLRLAAALAVLGVALRLGGGDPAQWLEWSLGERLPRLSLLVGGGAGVYFATLWAVGFRLGDFRRRATE